MVEIRGEDSVGDSMVRVTIDFPLFVLSEEKEQQLIEAVAKLHPGVVSQEDVLKITFEPFAEQIARQLAVLHYVGPRSLGMALPLLAEKLNEYGEQIASILEIARDVEGTSSG